MGSAGKNPEASDSPWVNQYRKSRWLWGHSDKDTVTFLRLSTSDANCHTGPQATLLRRLRYKFPRPLISTTLGISGSTNTYPETEQVNSRLF